jgi:L-ascorbate metabolism protein UlaG (beta-lactamase superfamily)
MKPSILMLMMMTALCNSPAFGQYESDVIETSAGELTLYFIGHGTLMFTWGDLVIHIDPVTREADYKQLPDADLILVTHEHGDHLDFNAISQLEKAGTRLVMTQACIDQLEDVEAIVMGNGDRKTIHGVNVEAVPAYNIAHVRPDGTPFHPKGNGNGYVLTFGDTRVLIAGDTENIPELKALEGIDVAFLPMNLPYTMDPEMVADVALAMRPHILYPYHFGNTDPRELVELLKGANDIEVRVRELQ